MGMSISSPNSFLILQGIETLAVRMDRICENTERVARYLSDSPHVSWVRYAGLPDDPDHVLTERYLGGRAPGLLSFGIHGGAEAGARFLDALKLVTRLVNTGDAKSFAAHPASATPRQLSAAELKRAGVTEDMIRLSIGIEHIDDILTDIEQALRAAVQRPRLVGNA